MVFNRSGATSRLEKVIHEVPTYSAICWGFRKMAKTQREALVKLCNLLYYITVKGRAFTHFEDLIELEKLHGAKFQSGSYENESRYKDFIKKLTS